MTPLKELSQLLSSIIESKDIEMDEMWDIEFKNYFKKSVNSK
jgi:hypothetical protein